MKKKLLTGVLAAALVLGALPTAALAAEENRGGVTIAPRPENVTIAPRPEDALIAPNPMAQITRTEAVTRLWKLSGEPVVNALLTFADVTEGTDEAEAIRWAAAEGITSGYTATWFGGGDLVTREQLAAMIYRLVQRYDMGFRGAWMFHLSCADLDDVQEWAFEPMFWMVASRLYDGSDDALLRPQAGVTAGEADTILAGLQKLGEEKDVDFTAMK